MASASCIRAWRSASLSPGVPVLCWLWRLLPALHCMGQQTQYTSHLVREEHAGLNRHHQLVVCLHPLHLLASAFISSSEGMVMLQFWFAIGSCCGQVELQVSKVWHPHKLVSLHRPSRTCSMLAANDSHSTSAAVILRFQMHFEMALPQERANCIKVFKARLFICSVASTASESQAVTY